MVALGKQLDRSGAAPGLPHLRCVLELPAIMDPSNTRLMRVHNRIVKDSLVECMFTHHKKRIWQHFNRWQQKKYHFAKRAESTRRLKKGKHTAADLVRTGATKRSCVRAMKVSVRGKENNIRATGRMKWGRTLKENPNGIKVAVMADEITRMTEQEEMEVQKQFSEAYIDKIDREVKSQRRRKKITWSASSGRG